MQGLIHGGFFVSRGHLEFIYIFQILKTYNVGIHARWGLRCLKTAKILQINENYSKRQIHMNKYTYYVKLFDINE